MARAAGLPGDGVLKALLRMPMYHAEPMTTRHPRRLLTVLALLLQVLAILGGAKGVVVCVGQAGHVAVEDYKAAQICRESSAGFAADADVASGSAAVAAPADCVDTPLWVATFERATSPARGHDVAIAPSPASALPLAPLLAIAVARATAPPPSTHVLRSVVLLI